VNQAVKTIGIDQPRRIIGRTNFSAPTAHSLRHYAVSRIMPSNIIQTGGSLAIRPILLGIIKGF
jgi:hypothetical protein